MRPLQFPLKSYGFSGAETAKKTIFALENGIFRRGVLRIHAPPQFSMVVPLRSQARLRHSLLHWAYFALFRPQGARFVRPRRTRRRERLKRERASVPQFGMVVSHLRTTPPLAARCSVAAQGGVFPAHSRKRPRMDLQMPQSVVYYRQMPIRQEEELTWQTGIRRFTS